MKSSILLIITLVALTSHAQEKRVIIYDADTGEPLQSATIKAGGQFLQSAANGSFILPQNSTEIEISYNGYITKKIAAGKTTLHIALNKSSNALAEVVISANRIAQKRSEAPVAIATISKQTIEETKAVRIEQLINKISGVNMVNLGNEQHEMSIRQPMTTKSLFLYLEDGIPIRTTGLFNHNALLEMNMAAVRQIEVIKGPASSLYGAEAIGGLVNIITQAPPAFLSVKASIQASNTGYKRTDIQAGNTFGKFGLLVSGYYAARRDGPVDHSDFHKTAITVRGDYSISERTKWTNDITYVDYYSDMLGTLDSIKFLKRDYSTPQTFTYRKVPLVRYKSQLFHHWNDRSFSQVSFLYRNNSVQQNPSYRIRNAANNPSLAHGEMNESSFSTAMLILQHQQKFNFLSSKLIAGLSFDASPSKYKADYIRIERNDRGYYTRYAKTDSVLSQYKTGIRNVASYLHYEVTPAQGLKLIAALRYDIYQYDFVNALPPSAFTGAPSAISRFYRFSPKIGATYNHKGVGIYANYSEGFVPPQISELFSGVKIPTIGPQTFFNYEAGGWLSLAKDKLYADWSYYVLKGANEIISVRNQDGSTENKNAGRTKHAGVEYGVTYKPTGQLSLRFSATNSRHQFIEYVEKGISYNGMKMPGAPRFISNAEVNYKPAFLRSFRIGAEWQHLGSYFMDNSNTKKYKGYDLLNIRAGYAIRGFEIWINAMNATNKYYSTYASKSGTTISYNPGDPREFNVGVGYRFSKKEN